MRKRFLQLPLFLFLALGGCASGSVAAQKPTMDRDHAILSLARYRTIVKDAQFKKPETLSLVKKTDSFSFHDKELTEVKIELSVDTRYANGLEKESFPYAHFLLVSTYEGSYFGYESWVYAEKRTTGTVLNVFERGSEFKTNIRHEYVFESKRDWTDKAGDTLGMMDDLILQSADSIASFLEERSLDNSITSESYNEPVAAALSGSLTYSFDSQTSNEYSFEFEEYCLKNFKHKKDGALSTVTARWGLDITKDYPNKESFTLQSEAPAKAIR